MWVSGCAVRAAAQTTAPLITDVRIEQEGRTVDDRLLTRLVETTPGEPLSMKEVRETLSHLTSLNRFEDVQVFEEPATGGIRLRYVLFPLHLVDRLEFRGTMGLQERDVRRVVTERFGPAPAAGRAEDVADALRALYRDRGYRAAVVTAHIEETHLPDRATMVLQVAAGPRAAIGRVEVDEVDAAGRSLPAGDIGVRTGAAYDASAMLQALGRYTAGLRSQGFYEARAVHTASFEPGGTATVRVTIDRGPRVAIAFAGDPVPPTDRERLVPVRAEGSVDEDLLEDANVAIEEYLQARGYRDAMVDHARSERDGTVTITFTVKRGPRYLVDAVTIAGNASVPLADLEALLNI